MNRRLKTHKRKNGNHTGKTEIAQKMIQKTPVRALSAGQGFFLSR